ncbi:hypothetical protein J437_LFUL015555 [Ladona fulva]|uniref:CCHC-type domain-containing protein n=1 Tax=Ladona fulva TaxID=123851 RepID=A0A8K0KM83_LADFU|nr:hypothetical protein J437_LFUL015555 [Ladona fulva]
MAASHRRFKASRLKSEESYLKGPVQEIFKFRCFRCYKAGHKAVDCKNGKVSHHQSNAKLVEDNADDNYAAFDVKPSIAEEADHVCDDGRGRNTWILDSGCISHLFGEKDNFQWMDSSSQGNLSLANLSSMSVKGKGTVRIVAVNENDRRLVEFKDTLYVPDLRNNLVSVSKITDKGYSITFKEDFAVVSNPNGEVTMTAVRRGGFYHVREGFNANANVVMSKRQSEIRKWHERLGHLNYKDKRGKTFYHLSLLELGEEEEDLD